MFTNVTDHSVRPIVLLSRRYAQIGRFEFVLSK